ncbi:MAG: phosphodiester glycosidase family protein [Rhodobacterales bacterium]
MLGASLLALTGPQAASAVTCTAQSLDENSYTVCAVDMTQEDLRLFLNDASGVPYGQFQQVDASLRAQRKHLAFAMNGGMYHDDRAPVGHYVEDGSEQMRVITTPGPGNFGLLPNGILCIGKGRADVYETLRFVSEKPQCTYATQSGPMLVIDGALHPRFLPDSTSRYIRNGVGTSDDGKTAYFVISENAVTLYEFATFFRDGLTVPQALFLDGNISRLYAPELGRADIGRWMGPIIGVVESDE